VAQAVTASAARVPKSPGKLVAKSLEHVEEQILVCGNLLSWGFHGVAFHPAADRRLAWAGVAEALYRIRRADRLFGNTDLVMVKDVTDGQTEAEELVKFSYRSFETEPNMVLTLSASWKTYEDYLAGLKSDYRKAAIKVAKAIDNAGCRVELLTNVEAHAAALYSLYLSVHERQKMRLVTLSPDFIPALAASFNSDFRCSIVRRDDQLLGFVTTLRDGETAVGYYIGFEAGAIQRLPIYFRLLQTVVHDAIQLGCRRVSFGRTALEPKARLGARPEPFRVWIRHRVPALNLIIRNLIHAIHHDEAPDRNPFQSSSQS
jgi:predicted N-acyltransferase